MAENMVQIIGIRGLKQIGGRVREEYLALLKDWSKASKTYIEMTRDVVIGTMLDALKMPLLAADFDVEPAGQSEGDTAARDFLLANMDQMNRQTWRSFVYDCLSAIEFGFSISEIVLEKRDDGRMWLRNIEPRGQDTLWEWEFDEKDNATAYIQRDLLTGEQYFIPLEKCVHITFRGRKGNPQGEPILYSLYRPWRMLKDFENLEAIGVERDVGGVPVLTMPEQPLSPTDIQALKDALKGFRMDEEVYFLLPNGMVLTAYAGGTKSYNIGEIIDRKKKEILMRTHSQFLMLGMEQVGTQALVKGSQDFFMYGLRSVQEELLEAWNQQLVPLLFKVNHFAGMTDYPHITWGDPGQIDLKAWIDAYAAGVASKLITPVREDEERARDLMDLSQLPEGEGEGPREIEVAPGPGIWGK